MERSRSVLFRTISRFAGTMAVVFLAAGAASSSMCDPGPDADGDCVSDKREQELIDAFAPLLRFDAEEQYRLSSVPWYLPRVGMQIVCPSRTIVLRQPGQITSPSTMFFTVTCDDGQVHYAGYSTDASGEPRKPPYELFHDRENELERLETREGHLASAEIYAHVRSSPWPHLTTYDVTYWFFYPWNGDVVGTWGIDKGHHQGDWEHVTVRVESNGSGGWRMHSMFFATHVEGYWRWPSEVDKVAGTERPIVYVARKTHASYAKPGDYVLDPVGIDHANPTECTLGLAGEQDCWDAYSHVRNVGERGQLTPGVWFFEYSGQWGPNDGWKTESPRGPRARGTRPPAFIRASA